jgi:tRNA pseudouridine38-40 synthase
MRRIKLTVAYDGTDFYGWQVQRAGRTVQGELEKALEKLHKHPVRVHGSGRTDSGVHALGQCAHFDSDIPSIEPERYALALNTLLPRDLTIISSCETGDDFHARFSAVSRTYEYSLRSFETLNPMNSRYAAPVKSLPPLQLLNSYAREIVGIHDFTTFAAVGDKNESKIRQIHDAVWFTREDALVLKIRGNAFLWRMVRSIVGTMMDLYTQGKNGSSMKDILNACNRSEAGVTAPAQGLMLTRVDYE